MAKKTWIKIKRGILDPKHIEMLGQAWYLYFYILDQTEWETGTIPDWKDKYAADDLCKPIALIREHRKLLQRNKYITCEQGLHKQKIIVHNWIDPRRYDGQVQNPENQHEEIDEPCKTEEESHGTGHGTGHGFNIPEQNLHSSFNHIKHNTHHTPQNESEKNKRGLAYQKLFSYFVNSCKFIKPDNLYSVAYQLSWDNPIKDMLDISGWDAAMTIDNLKVAMERADKRHLTVSDPKSLFKLYQSVVAENARREMANVGKEFNPAEVI